MKRLVAWTSMVSLLLLCSISAAQLSHDNELDLDEVTRATYVGSSSIPDGVAFRIFLNSLETAAEDDQSLPIDHLEERLGLDRSDAADLVRQLLVELDAMKAEIHSFKRNANCSNGSAYTERVQVYALFDALDDGSESIAARRYNVFKTSLGPKNAALFQQLLNYQKANMTYIKFNHRNYTRLKAKTHFKN